MSYFEDLMFPFPYLYPFLCYIGSHLKLNFLVLEFLFGQHVQWNTDQKVINLLSQM